MNLLFLLIRILLGVTFLISGYAKLFAIEEFELSIMETGLFSWTIAQYISRLIIASEFLLGLTIVFRIYFKLSILLSILMLVLFSFYLVYLISFKPFVEDCGCFGDLMKMTPEISLIKNIVLMVLSFLVFGYYKGREDIIYLNQQPKKIIPYFIILSFLLPFILFPMGSQIEGIAYDKDYEMELPNQKFYIQDTFYEEIRLKDEQKIVAFFSLKCKHCKAAARKFKVMHDKNSKILPYIIFAGSGSEGNMKDLKKFQQETGIENFPYSFMEKEQFLATGGYSFPSIYFIENGKVVFKHNFLSINEDNLAAFISSEK